MKAKEEVTITITEDDANNLYVLLRESKDTGEKDWDKSIERIFKKVEKEINYL